MLTKMVYESLWIRETKTEIRIIFGDLFEYKWTVINCVLVHISVINWSKVMLDGVFFFWFELWILGKMHFSALLIIIERNCGMLLLLRKVCHYEKNCSSKTEKKIKKKTVEYIRVRCIFGKFGLVEMVICEWYVQRALLNWFLKIFSWKKKQTLKHKAIV